jgi:hypothetical protein
MSVFGAAPPSVFGSEGMSVWPSTGDSPTSQIIFNGQALPGLTFTRASGATRINQRGYLEEVAADVLRYSYDPSLTYNLAVNPWGDGTTYPDEWSVLFAGLTATMTGRTDNSDGTRTVEITISGTSNGNPQTITTTTNAGLPIDVPAVPGDVFAFDMGIEVMSLTGANARCWLSSVNSSGSVISANALQSGVITPGAPAARYRLSGALNNAGTFGALGGLRLDGVVNGVAVAGVVRLTFPVLNTGASYLADTVPIATLAQRVGTTPQYGLLGALIERIPATNLFLNSAVGVTQNVTTTAVQHTLSFTGTGSITLTGTSTAGPLVGTGASNRVSLVFTPSAGALTLTIAGDVRMVQLETGFLSSYIVTAGVTATRAADIANLDPALIDLNKSSIAMVFRVERGGVGVAATGVESHLSIVDADGSDQLLVNTNTAVFPRLLARRAAGVTTQVQLSAVGSGAFQTVAAAWDASATDGAFNGVTPSNSAVSPAGTTAAIQIGASGFSLTPSNQTIKRLSIWKGRRLTAAQVQAQSARPT